MRGCGDGGEGPQAGQEHVPQKPPRIHGGEQANVQHLLSLTEGLATGRSRCPWKCPRGDTEHHPPSGSKRLFWNGLLGNKGRREAMQTQPESPATRARGKSPGAPVAGGHPAQTRPLLLQKRRPARSKALGRFQATASGYCCQTHGAGVSAGPPHLPMPEERPRGPVRGRPRF